MNYDVILFDAAETLFTTRGAVGEIYGEVAARYGSSATPASIQSAFTRQFRHSGPLTAETEKLWWKDVVHRVFDDVGKIADFDRFFDEVYDQFRDSRGWRLFPETLDVLRELQRRSYRLGIVSNFDSRVYSVLRSLNVLAFFENVTISSETGYAKPHPEIFRAAIRAAGVPADHILYVGDNLSDDVLAGAKTGLHTVLIDRHGQHSQAAAAHGITSIQNLAELLNQVLTHRS